MRHAFRRSGVLPGHDLEYFDGFDLGLEGMRYWAYERSMRYERRMRFYEEERRFARTRWIVPDYNRPLGMTLPRRVRTRRFRLEDMDQSDKVALEMARQQQLFQARLSREEQGGRWTKPDEKTTAGRLGSTSSSDEGELKYNDDNREEDSHREMHLVVDNLLPLVKDLVEFGKQSDEFHGTTAQPDTDIAIWNDLTFEVLAAVARLATILEEWRQISEVQHFTSNEEVIADDSLAQTVRLLVTVRLPRITRLAAAVSQRRSELIIEHDNRTKNEPKPMLLQETVMATLNELPALVQKELEPIMGQLRDDVCEQMQTIVSGAVRSELERQQRNQEEAAEVQSMYPPKKWWWTG